MPPTAPDAMTVLENVLFPLGVRIWVDNKVDFSDSRNLLVAAITLVLGTGDFTLKFGGFALGGIGTATFGAIILYALLNRDESTGVSVADAPSVETTSR